MIHLMLGFVMALHAQAPTDSKEPKRADKLAEKIELKATTLAELEKYVAKKKGKPVVMDVWATWCLPCRSKFPKFVKLAEKQKKTASFLSLSVDSDDKEMEAKIFLETKKAAFANFRLTSDLSAFETKYQEGVPLYVVWDAEGKIVLKDDNLEKVEKKLEELVAKKSDV